ncbi:GNAT family N-acetyltransferase, partial [Brevundimonas sp.]
MRDAVIREAVEADFPAITAIYAENVANGCGTFELEAPELTEMKARFAYVAALGLPHLVAESDGMILGYAYAGPFR